MSENPPSSCENARILVPRQPSLAFFEQLSRKAELFSNQYEWSRQEVAAGRMTPEHQLRNLTRLWEELITPTDLPPLPVKFSC